MRNIKLLIFFLLTITMTSYGQSAIGTSGNCITNGDPNSVTKFDNQDARYDCMFLFDSVNDIWYEYDKDLTVGSRWLQIERVPIGGTDGQVLARNASGDLVWVDPQDAAALNYWTKNGNDLSYAEGNAIIKSGKTLHVNNSSNNRSLSLYYDNDFGIIKSGSSGLNNLTILAGKTGIGTETPQTELDLIGISQVTAKAGQYYQSILRANDEYSMYSGAVTGSVGGYIGMGTKYAYSYKYRPDATAASLINMKSDEIKFSINTGLTVGTVYSPTTIMTLNSVGNVGIGTTAPIVKLDVRGSMLGHTLSLGQGGNIEEAASLKFVENTNNAFEYGFRFRLNGITNTLHLETNQGSVASPSLINLMKFNRNNSDITTYGTVSGSDATAPNHFMTLGQAQAGAANYWTQPSISEIRHDGSNTAFKSHVGGYMYLSNTAHNNSTDYALNQSTAGSTALNAKTGQNLGLKINNSTKLLINSAGNVGIGTTAPSELLELQKTTYAYPATAGTTQSSGGRLRMSSAQTSQILDFGVHAAASWIQSGQSTNLATGRILLLNPNGGNVGIGTTTPQTLLDINGAKDVLGHGQVRIIDTAAMAEGVGGRLSFTGKYTSSILTKAPYIEAYKENNTTGNYGFALALGTRAHGSLLSEKMRITGTGNVGIGTTTPTSTLEVKGTNELAVLTLTSGDGSVNNTNVIGEINFNNSDASSDIAGITTSIKSVAEADFTSLAAAALTFNTNTGVRPAVMGERMRISSNGNVGIGTTTPTSTLEVKGEGSFSNNGNSLRLNNLDGYNNYLNFFNKLSADINTGKTTINSGRAGDGSTVMAFSTSNAGTTSEAMRITPTKALLINTITDNNIDKLSVGGSGKFTGTLNVGGNTSIGAATINAYSGRVLNIHTPTGVGSASRLKFTTGSETAINQGGSITYGTNHSFEFTNRSGGNFKFYGGRVEGSNAINSNEFVTKGQIDGGLGNQWDEPDITTFSTNRNNIQSTGSINIIGTNTALKVSGTSSMGLTLLANKKAYFDTEELNIRSLLGTSRIFIGLDNNVGIGTTTPTAKLEVAGSGKFGGDLDILGDIAMVGDNLTIEGLSAPTTHTYKHTVAGLDAEMTLEYIYPITSFAPTNSRQEVKLQLGVNDNNLTENSLLTPTFVSTDEVHYGLQNMSDINISDFNVDKLRLHPNNGNIQGLMRTSTSATTFGLAPASSYDDGAIMYVESQNDTDKALIEINATDTGYSFKGNDILDQEEIKGVVLDKASNKYKVVSSYGGASSFTYLPITAFGTHTSVTADDGDGMVSITPDLVDHTIKQIVYTIHEGSGSVETYTVRLMATKSNGIPVVVQSTTFSTAANTYGHKEVINISAEIYDTDVSYYINVSSASSNNCNGLSAILKIL